MHQSVNNSYRQAVINYLQKSELPLGQNIPSKDRLKDRSEAYCRSSFEDIPNPNCDINQLQDIATTLSAVFTQDNAQMQNLCNSGADLYLYQAKAYFTSAQNVQYVRPIQLCYIVLYAEALAEDGVLLRDEKQLLFRDLNELSDLGPSPKSDRTLQWSRDDYRRCRCRNLCPNHAGGHAFAHRRPPAR